MYIVFTLIISTSFATISTYQPLCYFILEDLLLFHWLCCWERTTSLRGQGSKIASSWGNSKVWCDNWKLDTSGGNIEVDAITNSHDDGVKSSWHFNKYESGPPFYVVNIDD